MRSTRAAIAAGIEPGDRAAIWAPNSADWILAALGVLGAGGAIVTLNTRFKGGEAAYVLRKSGARMLFLANDFLDTNYADDAAQRARPRPATTSPTSTGSSCSSGDAGGDTAWARLPRRRRVGLRGRRHARIDAIQGDDLADIMFTSGTTGHPKGAMSTHAQNLRVYEVWSEVVGLREGDRYLVVNPFFHGFGYKAGWFASILRGATIVPMAVFDVPAVHGEGAGGAHHVPARAAHAAVRAARVPGPRPVRPLVAAHRPSPARRWCRSSSSSGCAAR